MGSKQLYHSVVVNGFNNRTKPVALLKVSINICLIALVIDIADIDPNLYCFRKIDSHPNSPFYEMCTICSSSPVLFPFTLKETFNKSINNKIPNFDKVE